MTPSQVEETVGALKGSLRSTLGLGDIDLIDSASWYKEQFPSCGDWDSWIWETVCGRDYGTREHYFNGFAAFGDRLGKAGAGIVDLALRSGRLVLSYETDQPLRVIQRVVLIDPEDMASGWSFEATEIGG